MNAAEQIQIRIHDEARQSTLVYLPGLHGDWTLVSGFRQALTHRVRFIEITYPRTTVWTLADHANAVYDALQSNNVASGWILAESFGSQVAWAILEQTHESDDGRVNGFRPEGLILAGGFVRHPVIWGVRFIKALNSAMPMWLLMLACRAYVQYAKLRHRNSPETLASLSEFVERRSLESDRQAILHRYDLIVANDLRPIASKTPCPVYQLAGLFDPIVPCQAVRSWLTAHCPAYMDSHFIRRPAHNVLGTSPRRSAEQILKWMQVAKG